MIALKTRKTVDFLMPGTCAFRELSIRMMQSDNVRPTLATLQAVESDLLLTFSHYSIQTSRWRNFPHHTPLADFQRGRLEKRKRTEFYLDYQTLLDRSRKSMALEKILKQSSSLKRLTAIESGICHRKKDLEMPGGYRGSSVLIKASQGASWLEAARSLQFSSNPEQRLAEAFLIAIGLLVYHPFTDGNGRLSRIVLNILGSHESPAPRPFSVFLLLRNGRYLYNVMIPEIERFTPEHLLRAFTSGLLDLESTISTVAAEIQNRNKVENPHKNNFLEQLKSIEPHVYSCKNQPTQERNI